MDTAGRGHARNLFDNRKSRYRSVYIDRALRPTTRVFFVGGVLRRLAAGVDRCMPDRYHAGSCTLAPSQKDHVVCDRASLALGPFRRA
jgi:hypothetical protein